MKKRILLVEYAASTIDIIKEILSHPSFQLTLVSEGDAAKNELSQGSYDLLITAAMLPKFHGFNLSQYTAATYPGTRIIITSEIYKGPDYKHQAITQYKADDFFEKPFDKEEFKNRVFELLGVREEDLDHSPQQVTTTEIPLPTSDTAKIPTLKLLEEESKKMTSQDLFGDIIDAVQGGDSTYEIQLDGDSGPDNTSPDGPGATQVLTTPGSKKQKKKSAPDQKPPPSPDPKTQLLKVDELEPYIGSHETKPEEIFPFATQEMPLTTQEMPLTTKEMPLTTREMPLATQVLKKKDIPPPSQVTQKLDLDLLNLIKPEEKSKEKDKDKQKFKKIEDDISKKFEETLSGLGLGSNASNTSNAKAPPPPSPTPSSTSKVSKKTGELPPVTVPPGKAPKDKGEKDKKDDFGGYDILGLIARGGMAEIYKAKKKGVKGFEKLIALKKILSGYGGDDKYIEMFVDEAKIAAQLTHPHIVQIYDLGRKDDYYFIAMEYVSGKDLRDILHRLTDANSHMPEELAIYLVTKILEALNYAHAARDNSGKPLDIVHRDVSPPNILVSFNGDIKLTDFGVSKASIKMHHTVAGALKGKLLYMSPEQARGDSTIDYRSDIYSVAIILFELLTGEKLFLGTSEMGTLKKVQDGKVVKPSNIKKDIHPELEAIILKALEKDADKRYQKASDMIKALDAYMIKTYNNMPEAGHISHFIYTLFKEDINKEKIKVNLKPIPYSIKRIPRAAAPPTPHTPPTPSTPPDPLPETIIELIPEPLEPFELAEHPEYPEPAAAPPSPPMTTEELDPILLELPDPPQAPESDAELQDHAPADFQEDDEVDILELTEADQIKDEPPDTPSHLPTGVPEEVDNFKGQEDPETFQPVIEINFDEDQAKQQQAEVETSPHQALDTPSPMAAQFEAPPGQTVSKKKKNILIIAIVVILLLIAAIVYFLTAGSSPTSTSPSSGNGTSPTSGIQTNQQDSQSTGIPGANLNPNPEQGQDQGFSSSDGDQDTQPGTGEGQGEIEQTGSQEPTGQEDPRNNTDNSTGDTTQTVNQTDFQSPVIEKKDKPRKSKRSRNRKNSEITHPQETPPQTQKETRTNKDSKKENVRENKRENKKENKNESESYKQEQESQQQEAPGEKQDSQTSEPGGSKGMVPAVKETQSPPGETTPNESPKPQPIAQKVVKTGDILGINEVDSQPAPISTDVKISGGIRRLMMSDQRVMASFLVDHRGQVETVILIQKSSINKLNDKIIEAVKKWTFKPATKNNLKVKIWKSKWINITKR
ncbi:MAG: protein kinase [bacterium]|nr:protein kinase [bacterium]